MNRSASRHIVGKPQRSSTDKPSRSGRKIGKKSADFTSSDWYEKAVRLFAIRIDRRGAR